MSQPALSSLEFVIIYVIGSVGLEGYIHGSPNWIQIQIRIRWDLPKIRTNNKPQLTVIRFVQMEDASFSAESSTCFRCSNLQHYADSNVVICTQFELSRTMQVLCYRFASYMEYKSHFTQCRRVHESHKVNRVESTSFKFKL
jgi:hypothetical protein